MTCLVAWLAKDSNGPSSAYLASDSQITWGEDLIAKWSFGPKVIASATQPLLVGYCGDSLYGTSSLVHIVTLVDSGSLTGSLEDLVQVVGKLLRKSFREFPTEVFQTQAQFVFAFRVSIKEFRFYDLQLGREVEPVVQEVFADVKTGLVGIWGSGKNVYEEHHQRWQNSASGESSRAIYCAHGDAIKSGTDPRTGGAQQLAGLYRNGPGRMHGTLSNGLRHLAGLEVADEELPSVAAPIEWRNENFERCSPMSRVKLTDAQSQPRPKL